MTFFNRLCHLGVIRFISNFVKLLVSCLICLLYSTIFCLTSSTNAVVLNDFYKDFICKLDIFPSISMRDIVSIVLKAK